MIQRYVILNKINYFHTMQEQNKVENLNYFKELLFEAILISLQALYPYINQGNVNTINIALCDTWPKTLKKLRTMVEMEVKERRISLYQQNRLQQNDKSLEVFIKMSTLIMYLVKRISIKISFYKLLPKRLGLLAH